MQKYLENTLQSLTENLHGRLLIGNPQESINGFTTDTRRLTPGQIYVPLIAKRDGHNFYLNALEAGAAGILVQSEHPLIPEIVQSSAQLNRFVVEVKHTQEALYKLAHWYRLIHNCRTLGITGSVGKTSVKEMVAAFCSASGPTVASIANENNELGVPLTIGRLQSDTQYLIVEMGMRGLQEISLLSTVTSPDLAVITTIGRAHIGRLGSVGNIISAKLEIIDGLKEHGTLLVPDGLPIPKEIFPVFERKLEEVLARRPDIKVKRFGWNTDADYSLQDYQFLDFEGSRFTVVSKDIRVVIHIPLLGLSAAQNCLTATAAALELGVSPENIQLAAEQLKPTPGRLFPISFPKNIWIIDDTYNASPDSMVQSILFLAKLPNSMKKIALLGDMLELGSDAINEHKKIGEVLTKVNVDTLITVGYLSTIISNTYSTVSPNVVNYYIQNAAPEEIEKHQGQDLINEEIYKRIVNNLLDEIQPNTVLLIKASRAFKLERVVEQLIKALN